MTTLPQLTRILVNVSRSNAKVYGIVSSPSAKSSSEQFTTPQRMLHVRRGSVANPGDTVNDLGFYYVLGDFSRTANDAIFRMFHLPFNGNVQRTSHQIDPVSGFARNEAMSTIGKTWYDVRPLGQTTDVSNSKRQRYRIITGFPLQEGDLIGPSNYRISNVKFELGVTVAEAE
ncbi:hypothetical protein DF044_01955 [Burkholderia contaminans]|uniref:hypothetical protein n=1 Tax=Burkholderia contaminans TaxID=488447 RepID=UPI000F5B03FC|nr:hypothetical protein [Burkholderia contaminans]RQT19452.1 hypothetical protein DF044_01955 [Burkholderia contaminans]